MSVQVIVLLSNSGEETTSDSFKFFGRFTLWLSIKRPIGLTALRLDNFGGPWLFSLTKGCLGVLDETEISDWRPTDGDNFSSDFSNSFKFGLDRNVMGCFEFMGACFLLFSL